MKMFPLRRRLALSSLAAALLAAVANLPAQTTIDYANTDDDTTDYDTSAPNDPTTLNSLDAGSATQSGNLTGTGAVIKTGAGSITLTGANTYEGGTTLETGTLRLGWGSSFGTGALTINGGAVGNSADEVLAVIDNNVIVNGDFSIDALDATGGTLGAVEIYGDVALGAGTSRTVTLTSTGLACFGGAISGHNLSLVTTAPSSQAMFCSNTSNTFTGTLQVGSGITLELGKVEEGVIAVSGNLVVDAGATVSVLNANQFAATSDVEVNGTMRLASGGQSNQINALSGTGTIAADHADTLEVNSGTFHGTLADGDDQLHLTKKNTATLTLAGTNTYSGPTVVEGGKLVVTGSIASSATTVQTTGTLGGNGTAGSVTVESGGTLAPGGSLTVAGDLTLASGSLTELAINGPAIGTDYSAIDINGTGRIVTLGGTLAVRFADALVAENSASYALFDFGANTPTSDNFEAVKLYYGGTYQGDFSRSGRVWTIATPTALFRFDESTGVLTAVPEPRDFGLAIGVSMLLLIAHRRGRKISARR